MLIPICISGKDVDILATYTLNSWDSWAHKPGLTHLNMVHSPGPLWFCVCIINSYSILLNWLIVILMIVFYFIFFSNVFVF